MKVVCDCGKVVFEQEVVAPGTTLPDGKQVFTSTGILIEADKNADPATLLLLECLECKRTILDVRLVDGLTVTEGELKVEAVVGGDQ